MQDKISAYRTLVEIGAPQPRTIEIANPADLERVVDFPVFVKRPISTASSGVRQAKTRDELVMAANDLGLGFDPLIAQIQVTGPFAMVQAVADRGRLIAYHANLRVKEGIGGGAAIKQSVTIRGLAGILVDMVSSLEWHGGLSMDLTIGQRLSRAKAKIFETQRSRSPSATPVSGQIASAGAGGDLRRVRDRAL